MNRTDWKAPCVLCGYNGPGFFQPATHPCAAHETEREAMVEELALLKNARDDYRTEVERLRGAAQRADEEATKLANSELATTEQVIRSLRVENDALRAKVRTITDHYKPGWVDGLNAVARSAGFDPDKLRHEGVDPPTFIQDVIDLLRRDVSHLKDENERLRDATAEAASVMESIYESFRDAKSRGYGPDSAVGMIDPTDIDIGIGCWLAKHAPDSLPEKDGD